MKSQKSNPNPMSMTRPAILLPLLAQPGAVTLIPGVVFSGSLDGHLRAYSSATGKMVWEVDTRQEYQTVNGVKAHGGSLNGAGPTVVGGTVCVNSGYGIFGMPGNVLLAFSVGGR
jgi:polyvinyl alcohol dehydrogenase (cytochrome)